ncbi:alpha-glucan family phosphorylase [Coleofasciculus sp.]|uniref:alpha-glucan family phosphorylase n=1 Tax=Coleofasciculus sp. TaxID=3100458 RepID=UPI0040643287
MASASATDLKKKLPYPLHCLADLAFNFWWSWSPERLSIFRVINSQLWSECDRNPVKLLAMVSEERLAELAIDPYYLSRVGTLANQFRHYMDATNTWASQKLPQLQPQQPIAYFSIEYGFHPCISTYAGGLGVLAADHLKSASDLGVPLVGVGLLYRQGYFRQHFDGSGWQKEEYSDHTVEQLPLELCQDQQGQVLTIDIEIRDRTVHAQIWQVRLGRVNLYLLDTNFDDNQNIDRWITGQLYGGNQDTRLAQEILLGIGGVRALQKLGFDPQIYHLNEGNATFAMLEVVGVTNVLKNNLLPTSVPIDKKKAGNAVSQPNQSQPEQIYSTQMP